MYSSGHIATSYGLLKLPLMPELTAAHKAQFRGPPDQIDFNTIPYRDKQREASRQLKLEEYRKTGVWPSKKKKKMVRMFSNKIINLAAPSAVSPAR